MYHNNFANLHKYQFFFDLIALVQALLQNEMGQIVLEYTLTLLTELVYCLNQHFKEHSVATVLSVHFRIANDALFMLILIETYEILL